jgi:Tfp pilus assembly protein PilN
MMQINLLPCDQRWRRVGRDRFRNLLAVVLGLLVLCPFVTLAYVIHGESISSNIHRREEEVLLTAVTQRVAKLSEEIEREYRSAKRVQQAALRRTRPISLLFQLSRTIPPDVHLQELRIDDNGIYFQGMAKNQEELLSFRERLFSVVGDSYASMRRASWSRFDGRMVLEFEFILKTKR